MARPGPLRRPAAARRCPAATHRGPGRLRAEAAAGAGGGRGRGRWWRGAAALSREREAGQRRASPAPRGGTGKAAAGVSAWAAANLRETSLPGPAGLRGRLWSPGVAGAGRRLSLPGRGPGVRGAAVPLRRGGEPRYHCRFSPRPQGSGVPSQQPCCFTRPADSPQKRKLATRLLRLRGDNVRGESDATCRRVIPEVVCGL